MKQLYLILLFTLTFLNATANNTALVPSATISGNTTVCQNATGVVITFTGSGGTAPYTFTYTNPSGTQQTTPASSGSTITIPVVTNTVGTFTYTLVSVHDAVTSAEQSSSGTATVIVSAPPTIDFTFNNDNSCSDTVIQFTSSVSGTGTNSYYWDFGDGTPISNSQNPTHSFTSLGCATTIFSVVLTVTRGGCTVTRTHTINISQSNCKNRIC